MSSRLLDQPTVAPDVFDDLSRRELIVGATALGVLGACSRQAAGGSTDGEAASGLVVAGTVLSLPLVIDGLVPMLAAARDEA